MFPLRCVNATRLIVKNLVGRVRRAMNIMETLDFSSPLTKPKVRRGPIIPFETEKLERSRQFWQHYLIGTLLDLRRFIVNTMQRFVNRAWSLRDRVTITGRGGNHYVFHFNNTMDLYFIW